MSDTNEKSGYKFSNILKLSVEQDYASLHKEWECVDYRSGSNTQCICSRLIKHAYYYLNRINGNTIRVGSGCVKKLELPKKGEGRQSNPILLRFIQQWRGVYTNINDLLKYSEESRTDILDIIEETVKNVPISKKEELLVQVREMRDIFHKNGIDCKRIQGICDRLVLEISEYNEKQEWLRIQHQKQREKARQEEEKRLADAAAYAKIRRDTALYWHNRVLVSEPIVFETKKRPCIDQRLEEMERKEEEERLRIKEEEKKRHATDIQLSDNDRNQLMAMIMGYSNTS